MTLVIPSLQGGGAERVAVDLANHWSGQGREVTLIEIDRTESPRFGLDRHVRRVGLGLMATSRSPWGAIRNNIRRVRILRRAIRESQAAVIVSFVDITNVLTLLACRKLRVPVIVGERTDPRYHHIPRVWDWWRDRLYGGARTLVVQTTAVVSWAEAKNWRCSLVVIPNAAPDWASRPPSPHSAAQRRRVIAVGRLSAEKGHAKLIEAFQRLTGRFPDWELVIHGEGSERSHLERLISDLGVGERVALPGWTKDVESVLRGADLFVLPSRYEGFPNALLEAMAAGVACVSFDCDSGPREMIRHGIDGLLIPPGDVTALTEAMGSLMGDERWRRQLASQAHSVAERFGRAEVFRRWDEVLDAD